MKCIKILKSGLIVRLHENVAEKQVKAGLATYSNKKAWKENGRAVAEAKKVV